MHIVLICSSIKGKIMASNISSKTKLSDPLTQIESIDPLWPDATLIYGKIPNDPHYEAWVEEEENRIRHWIDSFSKTNNGHTWSSQFDMHAWRKQCIINEANDKIRQLREAIQNLENVKNGAKLSIQELKEAETKHHKNPPHRQKQSKDKQTIARKFTSIWVQSLMNSLGIDGHLEKYSMMQSMVKGSDRVNWRRWALEKNQITKTSLTDLLENSKITQGKYKGEFLRNVPVNPAHNDFLTLISLI